MSRKNSKGKRVVSLKKQPSVKKTDFYEPINLSNLYYTKGSIVTFYMNKEEDPLKDLPYQIDMQIMLNRRKVEMKHKFREAESKMTKWFNR